MAKIVTNVATTRKFTRLPNHIAIVPDGNGRWAEQRELPRLNGHQKGAENTYLYSAGLPNVDLLIRTGDELRLSNFLLWQTAYSEYHFTKVLWPNFGKEDMDRALLSYSRRRRRFGGL